MSRYPIVQTWKKYSKWKACEGQSGRLFFPPPCQGLVVGCLVEERLEMSCLLKTGTVALPSTLSCFKWQPMQWQAQRAAMPSLNIESQLILFLSITGLGVSLARSEFAKSSDVWPPILFMALTKAHISSTSDSKIDHLW